MGPPLWKDTQSKHKTIVAENRTPSVMKELRLIKATTPQYLELIYPNRHYKQIAYASIFLLPL